MMRFSAFLIAAMTALNGFSAGAETLSSAYTPLDLDKCRRIEPSGEPEDGGAWYCTGYHGMTVLVAAGDGRYFIAYGAKAKLPMQYLETLTGFHEIGKMMEWRLRNSAGTWRPFATILRYRGISDQAKFEELVVTRLGPEQSCFVATVDVLANPDANALVRRAADELVPGFRCGIDSPVRYGKTLGPAQIGVR